MNNSCLVVMQGINRDNQDDCEFWISACDELSRIDWGFNFRKDQQNHPVSQMYRMAKIVEIYTILILP